ncbi:hypothetical protein KKF60_01955 [Patescibacteria group bacterium]|nr:hypothetical protein [Patescibacteria group bacterium]MBU4458642.1 hypothetical protein [Patescibacteria group bacterium]MCG2696001.1 hypothetical protein [Candidatus Portnoybacteria bacterium]
MRHNINIKETVKRLRSRGKTYSEILKKIGCIIPKSTLSDWCNNVKLPKWYLVKINNLNNRNLGNAQKMAWASNKLKRERFLNELLSKNKYLVQKLKDKDVQKLILSVLHAAEGSKWKSHRGLLLGNSDPDIIKLYICLLGSCYNIRPEKLKCRISYRADQDINFLQRYWSRVTCIPIKNFYKTKPDPRTIGKPTKNKNYKGVCVVSCSGTHIQLELEAIPKLILKGI